MTKMRVNHHGKVVEIDSRLLTLAVHGTASFVPTADKRVYGITALQTDAREMGVEAKFLDCRIALRVARVALDEAAK